MVEDKESKRPTLTLKGTSQGAEPRANEDILRRLRKENPFSHDAEFQREFAEFDNAIKQDNEPIHLTMIQQLNARIASHKGTAKETMYVWLSHELFPEDIFFMSRLAANLVKENRDLDLATRLLVQVVRKDPSERVIFDLANVLSRQRKYEPALKWVRYMREHFPSHDAPKVLGLETHCLIKMRRFSDALRSVGEIIRLDPNNPIAYGLQAQAFIGQGKFDDALRSVGEKIRLDPNDPIAYGLQAQAFIGLINYKEALRAISTLDERVIEKNEWLLWLQAKCYGYGGDMLHCKQKLVRLLHINPRRNYTAAFLATLTKSTELEFGESALVEGLRQHFGEANFTVIEHEARTFDWRVAFGDLRSDEAYSRAVRNEFWSGLYEFGVDSLARRVTWPDKSEGL